MKTKKLSAGLLLALILLISALPMVEAKSSPPSLDKVEAFVADQLAGGGRANVFVKLASDANLRDVEGMVNRNDRLNAAHDRLTAHAAASQKDLLVFLDKQGVEYRSFWINNSVYVFDADQALVDVLAARADVAYVRGDHSVPLHAPVAQEISPSGGIQAVEWGVDLINAPDVWATGNTGEGVVVANIDTGVRYTHMALRNQYRGSLGGGSYDHDYSWWDPDGALAAPTDTNGHGTHTMGTMVGDDGGANQIGVAPGAQWIAAQGCDSVFCTDFDLISSAEWIACPTRVDGSDPDCTKAPDIVNNSWGGSGGDSWYQSYVDAWAAAGILPVFSAGNSGPSCNTVGSPGDYRNVMGIGATNISDTLASFSSKGPGVFRRLKPDFSAPGESVRSSYNTSDTSYAVLSGTSMAAPHVAGALALLSADTPGRSFNYYYRALRDTTVQTLGNPPDPDACGGRSYTTWPNPIYGWGRIDAAAAAAYIP